MSDTANEEHADTASQVAPALRAGEREERTVIEEPAKVLRLGEMIKQLLEEVRSAPLDEAARARLAQIHRRSLDELEGALSPELAEELKRITLPLGDTAPPSDAELRIAQAQLVGWLEGLFHGLQTAMMAQQLAEQARRSQGMRELSPGMTFGRGAAASNTDDPEVPRAADSGSAPGQYL